MAEQNLPDVGPPVLAVVGHPNKGKSSIVATLVQDNQVEISSEAGTTRYAAYIPLKVDDQTLYTLVDTPGFQRARGALEWMLEHESTDDKRPQVVHQFVETFSGQEMFRDECELLRPIVNGAGILYVVDGSIPYGEEYKPEMEILRWTGRPRMALINPIGGEKYVDEWKTSLDQYFTVKVFNAVSAEFDKQLELLRMFGMLYDGWRKPMARVVEALESRRQHQRQAAARAIASMLTEALTHVETKVIGFDDEPATHRAALEERFRNALRRREAVCHDQIEAIYDHPGIRRQNPDMQVLHEDVFSTESQRLFGLTRGQAIQIAAVGAAGAGALLDLALAGLTFGIFTAAFAVVGGVTGYVGFDKVARWQVVLHGRLGQKLLQCGPLINVGLQHSLLNRACLYHQLIATRSHARRTPVIVDSDQIGALNPLTTEMGRRLSADFRKLRSVNNDDVMRTELVDVMIAKIVQILDDIG